MERPGSMDLWFNRYCVIFQFSLLCGTDNNGIAICSWCEWFSGSCSSWNCHGNLIWNLGYFCWNNLCCEKNPSKNLTNNSGKPAVCDFWWYSTYRCRDPSSKDTKQDFNSNFKSILDNKGLQKRRTIHPRQSFHKIEEKWMKMRHALGFKYNVCRIFMFRI